MSDQSKLEDLRRRIQKDPASIAFAQLAEECRRAGQFQESVDVSLAGLQIHPTYLSARVTLGRALVALNRLEEAQIELAGVLQSAPENLAAIRGLADIFHRRGNIREALVQYRAAMALAPNDPDLERTIDHLTQTMEPSAPSARRESPVDATLTGVTTARAIRMIAALEQWLVAIHVARAQRNP